jgi:ribosomal protein L30/L7E
MHSARSRSPVCIRVSSVGDQVRDLKLHLVDHISLKSTNRSTSESLYKVFPLVTIVPMR